MSEKRSIETSAVSFSERLANSQVFASLFRDGMSLVEETATYLDGAGRQESKKLERSAALVYATESMRLTTRLMQLASWLLLHRAVKEGEMTLAQASKEKSKVRLASCDPGDAKSLALLPAEASGTDRALDQAANRSAQARRHDARPGSDQGLGRQSGRTADGPAARRFRAGQRLATSPAQHPE